MLVIVTLSGHKFTLDRHGINCNNRALKALRLTRPSETQIAYHYVCGTLPLPFDLSAKRTQADEWGNGHVVFLDRHHLNCGAQALNMIQLFRAHPQQIAYS